MNESRLDELIALSANLTSIIDHSCSSYVFDNTSKVAESYLPNLPELTLNEKVHKFLQSKSMEKTKKRSLQNLNNKKFKILVEKSNPEMNQNPPISGAILFWNQFFSFLLPSYSLHFLIWGWTISHLFLVFAYYHRIL